MLIRRIWTVVDRLKSLVEGQFGAVCSLKVIVDGVFSWNMGHRGGDHGAISVVGKSINMGTKSTDCSIIFVVWFASWHLH